jgi:hypothetical protein
VRGTRTKNKAAAARLIFFFFFSSCGTELYGLDKARPGGIACTLRYRHVMIDLDLALSLLPPLWTPRANWPSGSYSFCQRSYDLSSHTAAPFHKDGQLDTSQIIVRSILVRLQILQGSYWHGKRAEQGRKNSQTSARRRCIAYHSVACYRAGSNFVQPEKSL